MAPTAFETAIEFPVDGAMVRGRVYVADGPGSHPTIVEFKGSPGQPNGWIAARAPSHGFNGVWIDFRGQRSSEGLFDPGHTVEDAAALVAFLSTERARREWRMDSNRFILVGASSGTLAALQTARRDRRLQCVGAIVPFNWGLVGHMARTDSRVLGILTEAIARIAGTTEANARYMPAFVERVVANSVDWDAEIAAGALVDKTVFFAGAADDATAPLALHFAPLVAAARAAHARSVTETIVEDGHVLENTWQTVLGSLFQWARTDCLKSILP